MRLLTLIGSLCIALLFLAPVNAHGQLNKLKKKVKKVEQATRDVEQTTRSAERAAQNVERTSDRVGVSTGDTAGNAATTSPSAATSPNAAVATGAGVDLYVAPSGNNRNDGSKASPMKNLDKALAKAPPGARIHVAEGVYTGTFGVGYWEIHKPVELYGGYAADFSVRDPFTYLTLLQPPVDAFDKSASKHVMEMKKPLNGCVIDGFIFEGGVKTPYLAGKGQPEGVETGMMGVGPMSRNPEGVMLVVSGNNHVVRNNVFVNSSFGGISVRLGQGGDGDVEIANNVFVANRMSSIEGYGRNNTHGNTIDIHHNTILFSWSRLKDFGSFGYGIDVKSKAVFRIHENIIALNISAGISSQRFNTDLYLDDNLFFGNKNKDFWFNPASNVNLQINADEFADLELPSAEGNRNEQTKLPINQNYTAGFLNAQYTETVHYDPDSQANLMRELFGLNKRGSIDSRVTMFANRYPWRETLALFGAVPGVGAQPFQAGS